MPQFYPIAYTLVILGVVLYSLAPNPIQDEERQPIVKSPTTTSYV